MRIACIVDQIGKVQHSRVKKLSEMFPDIIFDVFTNNKFKTKHYDLVYYMSYYLYLKHPINHNNMITSITSHKSLVDLKSTVLTLRRFRRISTNNLQLFEIFRNKHQYVSYIPNGVDVHFFSLKSKGLHERMRLGWVGNIERATKNFYTIVRPLSKHCPEFKFDFVLSSKGKKFSRSSSDMVEYYHDLDYLLITSTTEGTPNPGLEAAACGVPLISTKVGNMVELIKDRVTGFLVGRPSLDEFVSALKLIKNVNYDKYKNMSEQIASDVRSNWSWEHRRQDYARFFGYRIL